MKSFISVKTLLIVNRVTAFVTKLSSAVLSRSLGFIVLSACMLVAGTAQAQVTVTISPTSALVPINTNKQFAATITGTTNMGVKWSVDGMIGGSSATGTISTGGLYTAPAATGNHVVTVTSNADPTQSSSSQVTVSTVSVTISPASVSLSTNATKQFAATVTGTTNTGVKWSVDGTIGGSSTTGTISTAGLYTAPAAAGNHVVTATSNADPTQSSSSQVTVTVPPPITISISPTSASVITNATKQFIATVTGTTNTGVQWSVDGTIGGSSATGTISTGGLYTAPPTAGNHVVTATSNADPTQSSSSQVTVTVPTPITISIIPTSATVIGTQTKQYQATVTGTTNVGVKWSVDGMVGGNDTIGNISTAGMYLAPNTPGQHTVTITSNADPTKSATSALTINGFVWVVLRPYDACVPINSGLQYTAQVQGSTNQAVTWQVDNVTGGNSRIGTISLTGVYNSPSGAGRHTIKAISKANTSKTQSVSVTVASTTSVAVSPGTVPVPVGQTQPFVATVCGNSNQAVNWSVDGVAGGNATVGTIDASGVYTAPAAAGNHTIEAVSVADSSKNATATASVFAAVTADFGNRTATAYPIPPNMFTTNLTNLTDPQGFALLTDAGISEARIYSRIEGVYATRTADWTKIDPMVQKLQIAGIRPMLEITLTPTWLVPSVPGCTPSFKMPPTDYATYAQLAASFVAHLDQTFPGFVIDYEIWNEPDLGSFCTNPNTDAQRRSVYLSLYAAVAKAMHDQAALDGVTIRTGGPTTVTGSYTTWIPALVSTPSTSPYVDFISYHQYPTGTTNSQAGIQWDGTGGPTTLYSITQSSGGYGALFQKISLLVRQGLQPNPTTTPIYVTEYNNSFAFTQDCCRNDPTISPVFNGLVTIDYLNSVYAGAQQVPGKLYYYSASAFPYFCLVGIWDSQMTCSYPPGSTPVAYPQYQAYNLFSSPNFLGLVNGGYMAVSVSPAVGSSGIAATAFFTLTKEAIVIVNPTATSYSAVQLAFNNTGLSTPTGTQYRIDGPNNIIVEGTVSLQPASGGFTATIQVPAYSVTAVSIQ